MNNIGSLLLDKLHLTNGKLHGQLGLVRIRSVNEEMNWRMLKRQERWKEAQG